MYRHFLLGALLFTGSITSSYALTISTEFNTSDGFVTGDLAPVTLSNGALSVTFNDGQQQQGFDGPSYNQGPAGFLFINGGTGFTGSSGNTAVSTGDIGFIDFNIGVTEISFFGANRANGPGTTINVLGVDDETILDTIFISQTDINPNTPGDDPILTEIFSSAFGGALIGGLEINLPGPANPVNPPYAFAIDSFSATAPVPVPAAVWLLGSALLGLTGLRRKRT